MENNKSFPEGLNIGGASLTPGIRGTIKTPPLVWDASGVSQSNDFTIRTRVTLAEMNAGKTLATPPAGCAWRLVDVKCISIGGSLAATSDATGYAIYGTQAGSEVALFNVDLAAAVQSAVCQPGVTDTDVLADGASFAKCDANASLTCKAVSAGAFDLVTTTYFDIILTLALEV